MSFFSDKRILIISPEPWGVNSVSKHHYANILAEQGCSVYYLNPPDARLTRAYLTRQAGENRNLTIVDYKPLFRGLNRLPAPLNNLCTFFELRRIAPAWNRSLDIVWSFDPFRFQNMDLFNADVGIYHTVDIHNTPQERRVAGYADIIFATSDMILNRLDKIATPKYKVGHGLAGHFTGEVAPIALPVPGNSIKVGYVGNLHYKFLAKDLLRKIVLENPQVAFYFIGPYEFSNLSGGSVNSDLIDFLRSCAHAHLLGPVPSVMLPGYINSFDLFLICYASDTHQDQLANPHKILEYLSTGKTVVSTYIDEYKDKTHLVEMVTSERELPERFSRVVADIGHYNSPDKVRLRKLYAVENTYEKQLSKISTYLTAL